MPSISPRPKFEFSGHTYQTQDSANGILLTQSLDENLFIIFNQEPLLPIIIFPIYTPFTASQAKELFKLVSKSPEKFGINLNM